MYRVSPGIEKLAFIQDAVGFHVIDFKQARKMQRNLLIVKAGQKFGTFSDGVRSWVACVPLFTSKRYKPKPQMSPGAGESARMTPSRPTNGSVWSGTYARRLSGLVAGHRESEELFKAWKPAYQLSPTVSEQLTNAISGRAVLFMPSDGKKPRAGRDVEARQKYEVRSTENGWEVRDGEDWVLLTDIEAREMLSAGRAVEVL